MSLVKSQVGLQLPFLDAILDDEPEVSKESFTNLARKLREYRQSVILDIERLLNSKCNIVSALELFPGDIMYSYGVGDFAHINVSSLSGQEDLRQRIVDVIRENEPRLSYVDVLIIENIESDNRLNFRIEGKLRIFADTDLLILNASFEPASKAFTLKNTIR